MTITLRPRPAREFVACVVPSSRKISKKHRPDRPKTSSKAAMKDSFTHKTRHPNLLLPNTIDSTAYENVQPLLPKESAVSVVISATECTAPAKCTLEMTDPNPVDPNETIGRDREKKIIETFLSANLNTPAPLAVRRKPSAINCLYISGSPGIGKTVLVNQFVSLHTSKAVPVPGIGPKVEVIQINCFSLGSPNQIFSSLVRSVCQGVGLLDRSVMAGRHSMSTLQSVLSKVIARNSSVKLLIILDELDALTPNKTPHSAADYAIIQNLLKVLTEFHHNVCLITISNQLMNPDLLLSNPTGAPLRAEILNFPPYTAPELIKILRSQFPSLDPAAAMFLAKSTLKESSDVRNALSVCRLAIKRASRLGKSQAFIDDVHSVLRSQCTTVQPASSTPTGSGTGNAAIHRIRSIPLHAKLILTTLALHAEVISGIALYDAYTTLVPKFPAPINRLFEDEFGDVLDSMEHEALLCFEVYSKASSRLSGGGRRNGAWQTALVSLEVPVCDVVIGLTLVPVDSCHTGGSISVDFFKSVLDTDALRKSVSG